MSLSVRCKSVVVIFTAEIDFLSNSPFRLIFPFVYKETFIRLTDVLEVVLQEKCTNRILGLSR